MWSEFTDPLPPSKSHDSLRRFSLCSAALWEEAFTGGERGHALLRNVNHFMKPATENSFKVQGKSGSEVSVKSEPPIWPSRIRRRQAKLVSKTRTSVRFRGCAAGFGAAAGGSRPMTPQNCQCQCQTPSTGIRHPSFNPTAVFVVTYAIGSIKLSANEQFFVGAQTVVSLLQATQVIQGVSFIAANKVYTSANKTTIV